MVKLVASVLLVTATVRAEPHTCKPAGAVIVEVAQRAAPRHKIVTASTRLYANGTVHTDVFDVDNKLMRTNRRCLERAQIELIRDDLKSATWKTSPAPAPCLSSSPRFTVYRWNGASMFVERTCGPRPDAETRRMLERLSAWLHVPELDDAIDDCVNPLARGCS